MNPVPLQIILESSLASRGSLAKGNPQLLEERRLESRQQILIETTVYHCSTAFKVSLGNSLSSPKVTWQADFT